MADSLPQHLQALKERYQVERELGHGGMATVYLAQDLKLHRQVALKVLRPELAASLGNERFLREIAIAARLSHPHILSLHDSGEAGGHLYYAMPYVEGESLRQRLEREGQLPVADVLAIVRAVASALTYAHHHGVVHRDIKPENILLARDSEGGAPHPLVADFGLARALDAAGGERLTESGIALGTPAYMSPEQSAAEGRLDGRSDIYALGCVAYEMLAGAPPFTGPTAQSILARHAVDAVPPLHTVRATVPPPVEAAIERALAKVPADRFASADEFAQALAADRASRQPLLRRLTARRGRLLVGSLSAAALGGIATVALRGSAARSIPITASTIAVLPFRSTTTDTALTRLGQDLATTVSASLDGVGGIQTADRLRIAQEIGSRLTDSPTEVSDLGRRVGARSVLRGTLVQDGPNVRVDLGLYETTGMAPLAQGITVVGARDSLGALTDSVVWALLRQVWKRGEPPSPSLAAVTTSSLPALRAFLDGERAIEKDRWDAAALAFRSAMAADSTFWLAYFRYVLAQYWREQEPEAEFLDALHQHRLTFPQRERLLVDGWGPTNRDSFPVQVELYREATRRFPDYWPGWFLLGDRLFHAGPLLGHRWTESHQAFTRAVALNPRLKPAWVHLWSLGVRNDTLESGRALAHVLSFSSSDLSGAAAEKEEHLHRILRFEDRLARAEGVITPRINALADSVARDWVSLEATPLQRQLGGWTLMWFGFPIAQIEWNRKVLGVLPRKGNLHRGNAWAWAQRGAWDSALVSMRQALRMEPHPLDQTPVSALDDYGLAVLGAWLGTIDTTEAVQRRPAAGAFVASLGAGERKTESLGTLFWLDGILAFARKDRLALSRARLEGSRSGHSQARLIDRSLVAFGKALAGDRAAAGRELAEMETRWEGPWNYEDVVTPNIAIHRIAAATWLLEAGDTTQAARLLIWHEAPVAFWEWSLSYGVTALAYLMQARIEEARGDTQSAMKHYRQFLRRYDMPMPRQRHLVDEAQAGLVRLSSLGDESVPR